MYLIHEGSSQEMKGDKIGTFMRLAGQAVAEEFITASPAERKLGAQLLLSEVLEYVIKGLGITPEIHGVRVSDPEAIHYHTERSPDKEQMLDGLADVAYTMYWNALAFGVPLEDGFDLVCDNNLDKFVKLENWKGGARKLETSEWACGRGITWPSDVIAVEAVLVEGDFYAVGKDGRNKVRKPSSYKAVDLSGLAA
jgi:predicted HAD superfamily Cof-like phosphohydrolase